MKKKERQRVDDNASKNLFKKNVTIFFQFIFQFDVDENEND